MLLAFRSKSYYSRCLYVRPFKNGLSTNVLVILYRLAFFVNLSEFEHNWRSWCATCKPHAALSQEWFANSLWMDHRTVLNPLLSLSSVVLLKLNGFSFNNTHTHTHTHTHTCINEYQRVATTNLHKCMTGV